MKSTPSKAIARLWLEAFRSRWSLRLAAGESAWWLIWRMLCWLCVFPRQTHWLQAVDASPAMREAARTDPRLYERWHHPCISPRFGPDARRRILAAHYDFVQHQLPARMRERVLHSRDIRVAMLRLDGEAPVTLHLRKPPRAEAGELALLLLTGDKAVLAACVLTFAGAEGLLVGSLRNTTPAAGETAIRAFQRGSHGLDPRELLHLLVRDLAAFHGLACVDTTRLPPKAGSVTTGRYQLAQQPHREAFCRKACSVFLDAFRDPQKRQPPRHAGAVDANAPAMAQNLLAANL